MASALGEGLAEKVNQAKDAIQGAVTGSVDEKPAKTEKIPLVNRAGESRSPYVSEKMSCWTPL